MTYATIDLQVSDAIATLTLDRPDKRNAMSDEMRREFVDALERTAADPAIRALVLTGAGKGFCAGGDIAGMERRMQAPAGEIAFNGWHRQQGVHHAQALLHTLPKPVIAAVNGAASGLGADTALACDFIMASEHANFAWSYIHRGIVPDGGGMYFLPRRVGLPKAKELIFTGRKVEVDEALALGIVDRKVPAADLVREADILARFRFSGSDFVLRHPPAHLRSNSNETMRREARVLRALAGTAVPHPGLIADCPEEDVLKGAFYLMEPVDGFNATMGLPALHSGSESVRHRMGLAIAEGAAALGQLDHLALGLESFGRPDNFLERQVSRWRDQLASYGDFAGWTGLNDIPGVERVASWLDANRPEQGRAGILHGDYHLANVMYAPGSGELAAIVDWELATIGDPLLDLGWLLATWPDPEDDDEPSVTPWTGFPDSTELVKAYGRVSDRDLSAIDWYAVLACYKLGILLEGSHARASAGKAPRDIGDRLHAKTISLFHRALRWIA